MNLKSMSILLEPFLIFSMFCLCYVVFFVYENWESIMQQLTFQFLAWQSY